MRGLMRANRCCVCHNAEVDVLGQKDDRDIGRCTRCGLIYTLQFPLDYQALYTEGTRYHADRVGHAPYRERYMHDLGVADSRVAKLRNALKPRALDVGCANGAFVHTMAQRGYRAEGLEPNAAMADFARLRSGCPIHTSWDTVRGPFDVITYHDVIEHIEEPLEELKKAQSFLTPNGILVLDTPDGGHIDFLLNVLGNKHMKPQEHLWFFSELQLTELLRLAGMRVQETDRPIPGKLVLYARRS